MWFFPLAGIPLHANFEIFTLLLLKEPDPVDPPILKALLPLFSEKAATIVMVKHGMDIQKKITTSILVKFQLQLSINRSMLLPSMFIGDFLDCSGWTSALCEAGVASSGIADSLLKASHLTRTRRSHQI